MTITETTDPLGDLQVLPIVRSWLTDGDEDRYSLFYVYLSRALRARDPYYHLTVNQYELYYLDHYQLGDFSRAAVMAQAVPASDLFDIVRAELKKDRGE